MYNTYEYSENKMNKHTCKEYCRGQIICNRFKHGVGIIRCCPKCMMGATGLTGPTGIE